MASAAAARCVGWVVAQPARRSNRASSAAVRALLFRSQARCMSASAGGTESIVPVIDFGPFVEGTPEGKAAVAAEVGEACKTIGFLGIKNHGVPQPVIDAAWNATRAFFNQDEETKAEGLAMTADYPYGYIGLGKEILSAGREQETQGSVSGEAPPDCNESLAIGPYNPAAGMPPRRWPVGPPELQPAWEAYYQEMERLSANMLRCFALALDLHEDWFEDKIDRHRCALRALNYPEPPVAPLPGQLRASAHTDYGSLTILLQEASPGGLQVKAADERSGDWVGVPAVPGTFVINLGDLMARWTNDRWVSTLHRVVLPPPDAKGSTRRQSMAFFHNINADHLVTCIETCQGPGNPPKYAPITAFDHLMAKHLAATGGD